MTRRRASHHLTRVVIAAAVIAIVGLGVGVTIWGQKAAERRDYQAVLAGPSCQEVSRPPAYISPAALKAMAFGGANFRYLRGDTDCQTVRPGQLGGDQEVPYCLFDRPGFVEVRAGAAKAAYVIPLGQASILIEPHAVRCTVGPPA